MTHYKEPFRGNDTGRYELTRFSELGGPVVRGRPAPAKGTRDRKLYDKLWELCKARKVDDYTYKGSGKWLVTFAGRAQMSIGSQSLENELREMH